MSSLLFYVIVALILIAVAWLFFYQHKQAKKITTPKREPVIDFSASSSSPTDFCDNAAKPAAYNPDIIVLQIQSFPGKPYMGYELLQTLLSMELHFGEMNIFHRYDKNHDKNGKSNILFSVAAATAEGTFPIDDMGDFKCIGLVLYMDLKYKLKLMMRFDLMLDVARQLIEELGGEIYDDLCQPINAAVIRRMREKICAVETKNLYVADLLDNLD
jgi:cell division protein ZipA